MEIIYNLRGAYDIKMKFKTILITILIIALVILSYVGHLNIIKYSNDTQKVSNTTNNYEKINDDTKEKITSIVKTSKGEIPNLQTDSCQASWGTEAHNKQKEMMDKVLDTLTVIGEPSKRKPDKYIIATYDHMQIYIPYDEKTPYNKIIIEVNNHFYIATADENDINQIIEYMKNQGLLRA